MESKMVGPKRFTLLMEILKQVHKDAPSCFSEGGSMRWAAFDWLDYDVVCYLHHCQKAVTIWCKDYMETKMRLAQVFARSMLLALHLEQREYFLDFIIRFENGMHGACGAHILVELKSVDLVYYAVGDIWTNKLTTLLWSNVSV